MLPLSYDLSSFKSLVSRFVFNFGQAFWPVLWGTGTLVDIFLRKLFGTLDRCILKINSNHAPNNSRMTVGTTLMSQQTVLPSTAHQASFSVTMAPASIHLRSATITSTVLMVLMSLTVMRWVVCQCVLVWSLILYC